MEPHEAIAHVAVWVTEAQADWATLLTRIAPAMPDVPMELAAAINASTAALDLAAELARKYAGPARRPPGYSA